MTAGTVTEDNLLEGGRNNFLAALSIAPQDNRDDECALAWIDITTGEFSVSAFAESHLTSLLAQVDVAEGGARGMRVTVTLAAGDKGSVEAVETALADYLFESKVG